MDDNVWSERRLDDVWKLQLFVQVCFALLCAFFDKRYEGDASVSLGVFLLAFQFYYVGEFS